MIERETHTHIEVRRREKEKKKNMTKIGQGIASSSTPFEPENPTDLLDSADPSQSREKERKER